MKHCSDKNFSWFQKRHNFACRLFAFGRQTSNKSDSQARSARQPITGRNRRMLLPLTLLLLVSLACSIPSFGSTTVEPEVVQATPLSAEATLVLAPAEQAAQQPEYAPALIEVNPQPLSEFTPGTSPVFYFNQPMDRPSVEAAFRMQPEIGGTFEWIDDATMRFVPAQPLAAGEGLDLTIDTAARAVNGQSLAEAVVVRFQDPGTLRLAERLPAQDAVDVNPSSAIAVTFTRPVVALGAEAQDVPPAFSLEPAVPGRGEWINTSTYIFYPEPALQGGAQYTVRVNTSLVSSDGVALDPATAADWSFSTAAPLLLSVLPTFERPVELDSSFVLTFNQPMDTASVQADFNLLDPNGELLSGEFVWNDTLTELTFTPNNPLQRNGNYGLVLFGTARSLGGATLGTDFAASLVTVPQFSVVQTTPAAGETLRSYSGFASVIITFTSPIAPGQDYSRLVTLNPPIVGLTASRTLDGYQLIVSGYFQPSTSYTFTIDSSLRDRWDAALGLPFSFTFSTMPAQPVFDIPAVRAGGFSVFVPYGDRTLPGNATNISQIGLSSGPLTVAEFIQADQDWQGLQNWESKVQSKWDRFLNLEPNVNTQVDVPLNPSGDLLGAGLYFLKFDTQPVPDEGMSSTAPILVVVSPIQMVLKLSTRQAFVWAVRVAGREPAAGEIVSFYDPAVRKIGECVTGATGVCQAELPMPADPYQSIYAVIDQPGEPDFSLASSYWNNGVSPWDFHLFYQKKGLEPEIYMYTDRPIYRPGQAINFRTVVREWENGRYSAPALTGLTIDVVSPYDPVTYQSQVLTTLRLPLNSFGSAAGVYTLPADARPGRYTLRVQEVDFKEVYFDVAEYRKPEIDLALSFSDTDRSIGEDIQAQLSANYFFGAPSGNLPVSWTLFSEESYLNNIPGGLSIGALDTGWLYPWDGWRGVSRYIADGKAQTNPNGSLSIRVPADVLQERLDMSDGNPIKLVLEVTVEDESGLPVSARQSIVLHPAEYYIGVRPETWTAQVGQEITYYVRTVDWQSEPVAAKPLTARFSKVTWVQQEGLDSFAPPDYRMETTEVGTTDFQTSDQGEARLAFIPAEPGTFMFEVTGEGGAITQILTWVGGLGTAAWPNLPNQQILLQSDRLAYQPGQTAKVFIPNPFEGETVALVTVERGEVMRSQVVQFRGASYELELPLTVGDAPNIYLSVTLLGRTGIRPDFRIGYLELQVDPASLLLQVDVEANPQQPQPGGDLTLYIRVQDAAGSPVQGEFSLALVDKAVLSLSEPNSIPIAEAFYAPQPLGVLTGFSLAKYAGRSLYLPPGRGGGGGGDSTQSAGLREKFEDTAYWSGTIQTDVTGIAQVNVRLPDNLTTWRADVRGLTADTRVGQAEIDLVTGKPLLVRPVTPRFVVLGDHLELAAVVHNNTAEPIQAGVRLDAAGFNLDDPDSAVQPVEVPAGGRFRVTWWGTVQDVPSLTPVFSVEGGGLRDAAESEYGPLLVLRYTAPQTFGTAGILSAAGERVELVSLPRSFAAQGGDLRVEMAPSLSAAVIDGLKALENFPDDFTEPVLSRLLPNLAAYQAFNELQLQDAALRRTLESAVTESVARLVVLQNEDGGWGWASGSPSEAYLSSYVLLGLSRAAQAGVFVSPQVLQKGQEYLIATLVIPDVGIPAWELDRLAFQYYVLQQSGRSGSDLEILYTYRDRLSAWGKAFLALTLDASSPGDTRARTLLSDLQSSANRSASGANWQDPNPGWYNWSTPNFTTAVVTYAIARLDPASQVLQDAVRYLVLHRQPAGAWASSYESAWVLLALTETMRATGDTQARYLYNASLNESPLLSGQAEGAASALTPVTAVVPLSSLNASSPNTLTIQRGDGNGNLYYRAYLQVSRPAQDAPAIQRGLSLTRQYYQAGLDCRKVDCQPISEVELADPQPLLVRLTLTVPEDMYYVVVEDFFPAGAEVLNARLKTSQVYVVPESDPALEEEAPLLYDLSNPFEQGWRWWQFQNPETYSDRIRWVASYLPAGTYELTYRLTPFLAGEFRLIPARAWQYYFPEVEGTTAGSILTIR
jgi:alpha-2-macroglobulin